MKSVLKILVTTLTKDPPNSLKSPLPKIQTEPLYISTESPAAHFWDWAKPNISILYYIQHRWIIDEHMERTWGVLVAMDE